MLKSTTAARELRSFPADFELDERTDSSGSCTQFNLLENFLREPMAGHGDLDIRNEKIGCREHVPGPS